MQKIKILRNCAIKGLHHEVGAVAEVSEAEASILIGMGKATASAVKDEVKKKDKK